MNLMIAAAARAFGRKVSRKAATVLALRIYHASLAPDEYRTLLEANGFRVEAHVTEDPNCGHHTIWLAQAVR